MGRVSGVLRGSGVLGLKTVGCAIRLSGVLGRGTDDGVEGTLVRIAGVDTSVRTGIGGTGGMEIVSSGDGRARPVDTAGSDADDGRQVLVVAILV
jgi:hypothetical protein